MSTKLCPGNPEFVHCSDEGQQESGSRFFNIKEKVIITKSVFMGYDHVEHQCASENGEITLKCPTYVIQ